MNKCEYTTKNTIYNVQKTSDLKVILDELKRAYNFETTDNEHAEIIYDNVGIEINYYTRDLTSDYNDFNCIETIIFIIE